MPKPAYGKKKPMRKSNDGTGSKKPMKKGKKRVPAPKKPGQKGYKKPVKDKSGKSPGYSKKPIKGGKTASGAKYAPIQKHGGMYYVYSDRTGKRLSSGYKTRAEALKRMRQIIGFKYGKL